MAPAEHAGFNAVKIREILVEHPLAPSNDLDPLLDRRRRDDL
jgi:hypothetical protein